MNTQKTKKKQGKQPKDVSEQTKQKIISASIDVFSKEGYLNASLRDIALKAGTTHGLIRHYFGSKENLWKAFVDHCIESHIKNLIALKKLEKKLDPVAYFKEHIKAYIRFSVKNAAMFHILLYRDYDNSPHLAYIFKKISVIGEYTRPAFEKVQEHGYLKWIDHNSFSVYLSSLVESPVLANKFTSRLTNVDMFTEKGIRLHTKRIFQFIFREEK